MSWRKIVPAVGVARSAACVWNTSMPSLRYALSALRDNTSVEGVIF